MNQPPAQITPESDPAVWERLDEALHDAERILLTTHINPDGDAIGSEVALARYLLSLGKDVAVFNSQPTPGPFRFLTEDLPGLVQVYDGTLHRQRVLTSDAIVVLDTAEWARIGRLADVIQAAHGKLLVVDHHVAEREIGDVFLSVPGASSTGELIHTLLRRRLDALPLPICAALYVALATDTGWFRYNNTSSHVLRIAAELIDAGIEPNTIFSEVYENTTWDDVALFRLLVGSLRADCDGRVAVIHLGKTDYERFAGCDTDRILEYALSIPQTEVVLFFKHVASTATKLSLRSRGALDVGELARRHGGGGHRNASGVLAQVTPDALERVVLPEVREMLDASAAASDDGDTTGEASAGPDAHPATDPAQTTGA